MWLLGHDACMVSFEINRINRFQKIIQRAVIGKFIEYLYLKKLFPRCYYIQLK